MVHRENYPGHRKLFNVFSNILGSILLILLTFMTDSCKKDSFDSKSVTMNQLKGTWRGRITAFKNNTLIERSGDVTLFPNETGNFLDGIFEMGQINLIEGFMFQAGILYFNLICSDSTNPLCTKWNLGGYVFLEEENVMVIRIAGNECGLLGKQFVTYEGSLILINPGMDPSAYYSFGKTGASWTYETHLYNGTVCEVQQSIGSQPAPGLFTVTETNTCGWPFTQRQFNWMAEPVKLSVMAGTSATEILYTFYLDAMLGTTYCFINNADTTYLTLTDADYPVNVSAGSFNCGRYTIESRMHSSGDTTIRGTIYLNRQYGFILTEYTEPSDSLSIQSQVLTAVQIP